MDRPNADLVHLQVTQVGQESTTPVPLRSPQEDARMLPSETVDRIHELVAQGLGAKRIARQLGIARNTVRRYLAGARVGFQERPTARRADPPGGPTPLRHHGRGQRRRHPAGAGRARPPRRTPDDSAGRGGSPPPGPGAGPGHGAVRDQAGAATPDRLRGEARHDRQRPREGPPDDRGPGLLAAALLPRVPGAAAGRLARGARGGIPALRWPARAGPLRQRLPPGDLPRRPHRARTKGKIERGVGYVKHNALAGRSFASFAELQGHLARWMIEVADRRIHGTTGEEPLVRFEREERATLRPLPRRPLAVRTRRLTRRVSADCFVDVDTVRYSVPHRYVRETVEVVVEAQQVTIWLRGTCLARHRRCEEPRAWVRDPAHFEGLYRGQRPAAVATPAASAPTAAPGPLARPLSVYAELVEG